MCFSNEWRHEWNLEWFLKWLPCISYVVPHIFTKFLLQTNCVRNLDSNNKRLVASFLLSIIIFKIFFVSYRTCNFAFGLYVESLSHSSIKISYYHYTCKLHVIFQVKILFCPTWLFELVMYFLLILAGIVLFLAYLIVE